MDARTSTRSLSRTSSTSTVIVPTTESIPANPIHAARWTQRRPSHDSSSSKHSRTLKRSRALDDGEEEYLPSKRAKPRRIISRVRAFLCFAIPCLIAVSHLQTPSQASIAEASETDNAPLRSGGDSGSLMEGGPAGASHVPHKGGKPVQRRNSAATLASAHSSGDEKNSRGRIRAGASRKPSLVGLYSSWPLCDTLLYPRKLSSNLRPPFSSSTLTKTWIATRAELLISMRSCPSEALTHRHRVGMRRHDLLRRTVYQPRARARGTRGLSPLGPPLAHFLGARLGLLRSHLLVNWKSGCPPFGD